MQCYLLSVKFARLGQPFSEMVGLLVLIRTFDFTFIQSVHVLFSLRKSGWAKTRPAQPLAMAMPPAFFILVLSHYLLPSDCFFSSYYSSLYMQGWNLQAGMICFMQYIIPASSNTQEWGTARSCVRRSPHLLFGQDQAHSILCSHLVNRSEIG